MNEDKRINLPLIEIATKETVQAVYDWGCWEFSPSLPHPLASGIIVLPHNTRLLFDRIDANNTRLAYFRDWRPVWTIAYRVHPHQIRTHRVYELAGSLNVVRQESFYLVHLYRGAMLLFALNSKAITRSPNRQERATYVIDHTNLPFPHEKPWWKGASEPILYGTDPLNRDWTAFTDPPLHTMSAEDQNQLDAFFIHLEDVSPFLVQPDERLGVWFPLDSARLPTTSKNRR